MSNTLLSASAIANEGLLQFKNALGFTKGANRQLDKEFSQAGKKVGSVMNVRKPQRFTSSDGAVLDLQNVTNETVALTLDKRKHVAFQFGTDELSLSIEKFSESYVTPAAVSLANQVDLTGLAKSKSIWQSVGTPGTLPTTIDIALAAGQKLDENGCPKGDRTLILNSKVQRSVLNGTTGLYNPAGEVSDQYRDGVMSRAAGFDWRESQNIRQHTTGPLGGTPLIDGASQSGASILTKGWTAAAASRLKLGDVVTFAGVYSVNPLTYQSTGELMQFVLTADFSSDGSGNGTIAISPALVLTGSTQNVSALPADSAAILIFAHASTYANKVTPDCLAYHKDAFILGCADLEMPKNVDMSSYARDPESGLSIRFVRFYDGVNDRLVSRLDILFGWLVAHPEWVCRVQG